MSIHNSFFGKPIYILLAILAGIPIWIAAETFAQAIHASEDEAVAFATTVFFLLSIFAGRYVAAIGTGRNKRISTGLITGLSVVIIACVSWIFFFADFPLIQRTSISLLLFWLPFVIASLTTGALIKLIRLIGERQLNEARTAAANSQSELNALQSQLSPHFLFNTLNNLYGLSISQHEKIPPLLLKLSELLRYSVYEANETFVPLKDEIAYLNNYIEFEKLRIGDKLVLNAQLEEPASVGTKVAPMLLIVFIENAFKHSKNTAEQKIFIDISLKTWENFILFTIKNSHSKNRQEKTGVDKHSGYGMANVRKRLELLYPNEHNLEIQDEDDHYKVVLQLKMK
jgi:sensor histidine kinase YesM